MDTHAPARSTRPLQVVVMGVAGTGKSTIGALVAHDLGVELIEGDDHHPPSNIEKLSSGQPLTDEDRWPWLETLTTMLAEEREAGRSAVLTCSALRRAYRDLLRGEIPTDEVFFVHLHGSFEVLDERMRGAQALHAGRAAAVPARHAGAARARRSGRRRRRRAAGRAGRGAGPGGPDAVAGRPDLTRALCTSVSCG